MQRMSTEFNFTNTHYLQADILHLHQIDKKFDIIESSGVLHHMNNPMAGWKVLDLLKPILRRLACIVSLLEKYIAKFEKK